MSLLKLEEDKNQLSKGLDPWSNPTAATASTLHYLLQEKERAQAQEQLQIYHQQGFSYLQHQRRQQQLDAAVLAHQGDAVVGHREGVLARRRRRRRLRRRLRDAQARRCPAAEDGPAHDAQAAQEALPGAQVRRRPVAEGAADLMQLKK